MTDTELLPCRYCGEVPTLCTANNGANYISHANGRCVVGRRNIRGPNVVELWNTRPALDHKVEASEVGDMPACRCGTLLSRNPHPDAGEPSTVCEVGAVWECIPCQSLTLHKWSIRALDAEAELARARKDALEEAAKRCDTLYSAFGSDADAEDCAETIRALTKKGDA